MKNLWIAAAGAIRLPVVVGATLAFASGSLAWRRLWLWLGLMLATMALNGALLARWNAELLAERFRRRSGTEAFDRWFAGLSAIVLIALAVVAGLDGGRFGWSAPPPWLVWAGVALHVAGNTMVAWAMCVNRHLETTVRLQSDRGHGVVAAGPYAVIRHPMYTGMLIMFAGWPLILDSLWALAPYGLYVVLLVWRTGREDRMLRRTLDGYAGYASRTRYRLAPGVW